MKKLFKIISKLNSQVLKIIKLTNNKYKIKQIIMGMNKVNKNKNKNMERKGKRNHWKMKWEGVGGGGAAAPGRWGLF